MEKTTRDRLREGLRELRGLREEIEAGLRHAGADLRETWHRIEPRVTELELQAFGASGKAMDSAAETLAKLAAALRELVGRLRPPTVAQRPPQG